MGFLKKFLFGQMSQFGPRNGRCKNFYKRLHNERGQWVDKNNINFFQRSVCSGQMNDFGPKNGATS